MKNRIKYALSSLLLMGMTCYDALAKDFTDGKSVLNDLKTTLGNLGGTIINVVFIVSGIIMAVGLIPAGIAFIGGKDHTNDSLTKLGIGGLVIFVILGVIKAIMAFS